jgi:pectate lyase-like protein
MVKPGSVVHVLPGTYGNVTTTISGTSTARIRFISDTRWGAHVVGTAGSEAVWQNQGNYVDIMGFDITGNSPNGLENLASFSRMIGNRVHDIVASCDSNGGSGINNANYSASDDDIIANVVFNIRQSSSCTSKHGVGIYHSNLRGHVLNNISFNNGTVGIQLWHAANAVVVANNTVFKNGVNGVVIGAGDSPGGITNDNSIVSNNIAYSNNNYGIQEFGTTGSHNQFLHNLAFGNPDGDLSLQTGSASGTILSNPQFVSYTGDSSGNYHLQSSSPAIDSGTTTGMPSTDLDGSARPVGSGPDIGAYEYNSPAGLWPWI